MNEMSLNQQSKRSKSKDNLDDIPNFAIFDEPILLQIFCGELPQDLECIRKGIESIADDIGGVSRWKKTVLLRVGTWKDRLGQIAKGS